MLDLNELCKIAYENTCKRAEHESDIKIGTMEALKHCAGEVVEAGEALTLYAICKQDGSEEVNNKTKEAFADELADIVCCVLTICGQENIDIELALTKCMEKNFKRGKQDETC